MPARSPIFRNPLCFRLRDDQLINDRWTFAGLRTAGSAVVFYFQCLCDSCIKTLELLPSGHQAPFGCLINGWLMVLIVDEHTFLDFSLIKESLACCPNCVSDAVLLGSTVKICSAALFQCRVLAFSPERTTLFSLSLCGEHIVHTGRCRRSIADPPFVRWWHTDWFE